KVKYEADIKAREDKLKTAEEKVASLNARFADWYYVISAENFEHLRPSRKTLVKEKPEANAQEKKEGEAAAPESTDSSTPDKDDAAKDEKKPEGEAASESKDQPGAEKAPK